MCFFNHVQFVLLTSRHCAHQRWHSHSSQCCHCWPNVSELIFPILCNWKIYYFKYNSSLKKELLQPTPHWLNPPFSNWGIWMSTQTCLRVLTQLCQCHLELERVGGPSSFCFSYFFSSKNFNHITKDANIFHLKLGGNHKPNYLLTSNLLRHTSHHHDRPYCRWLIFDMEKYSWHITGDWFWTWRDFDIEFELTWCLINSPFSFFLFLCTFFKSTMCL